MSGGKPIFFSAMLLTMVNLLLRFIGTGFQVYLSGHIGPEGIGLLQLVMSVGAMATVAGMAGIRTASMYLTAEEFGHGKGENTRWVLSGCILYSLVCGAAVACLLFVSAPQLAEKWIGNSDTVDTIRLYAAFLPVHCLTGVMVGHFTGAQKVGLLAMVEVAEQLMGMCITLALLRFWAGQDAARCCLAVIMGSGIGSCMTLCCLVMLRQRWKLKAARKIPVLRRLVDTAVPLAIADDLRTGITTVENLMVPRRLALYSGASSPLAMFGTVCGMVFPVLMFPMAILYGLTELLIPELARCRAAGSQKRIEYLVHRSLRLALLYGTLCAGILFSCAESICLRLYSNEEAGHYLRLFAPLAVMLYCDGVTDAMIKGLGQQKASVRYNILTNCLDVALLYILLPRFGIHGYYFSFLVSHALNFYLSIRRLTKISRVTPSVSTVVITLSAAVLAVSATGFVPQPTVRALVYCIILVSSLCLTNVLGKADLLWLRGLVKR